MNLVVDVQGFKTTKTTFVPKELAVYDGCRLSHYIFKPPFAFHMLDDFHKKQAKWLIKNHHCISWEIGFTPAYCFPSIFQRLTNTSDVTHIYVKGKEKADYLKTLTRKPIVELEEHPPLISAEPKCFYHITSPCICAVSNVYNLYHNYVMQ